MFDIVNKKDNTLLNAAKELGYSEIYTLDDFNIVIGGYKNRYAVENKQIDILLNPHLGIKKDNLHYRKSGLNHILCKLAHENNVAIAFSFDALRNQGDLGRVMQDIKLCKKYGVKILFVSLAENKSQLRSVHDVLSFAFVLGAEKKMFLTKKIKKGK